MTRNFPILLAAVALAACASQPEPSRTAGPPGSPTRTLQDLNGSKIALPVALFLTSLDIDRNGSVGREEVRSGGAESFMASDANGDGYLRPVEFEAWSRTHLGSDYTTPGRLQFDSDQDGRVSPEEFGITFAGIFQRLDVDGDGELVRAELLTEINGTGVDPAAIRAQVEAEMRQSMQGRMREMCQRGGRGM